MDDDHRARERLEERARILRGLDAALSVWPEVSVIAFEAETVDDLREALQARFDLDEVQANAVLEAQVRRVTVREREKIADELRRLEADLGRLS